MSTTMAVETLSSFILLKTIRKMTKYIPVEQGFRKTFIIGHISFIVKVLMQCFTKFISIECIYGISDTEFLQVVDESKMDLMAIFGVEGIHVEYNRDNGLPLLLVPEFWLVSKSGFIMFGKINLIFEVKDEEMKKTIMGGRNILVEVNTSENPTFHQISEKVQSSTEGRLVIREFPYDGKTYVPENFFLSIECARSCVVYFIV
jgi:hypothetical protein